jgi:phage shock protein A
MPAETAEEYIKRIHDDLAQARAEVERLTNDLQECQSRWEGWRHEQAMKDAEVDGLKTNTLALHKLLDKWSSENERLTSLLGGRRSGYESVVRDNEELGFQVASLRAENEELRKHSFVRRDEGEQGNWRG